MQQRPVDETPAGLSLYSTIKSAEQFGLPELPLSWSILSMWTSSLLACRSVDRLLFINLGLRSRYEVYVHAQKEFD